MDIPANLNAERAALGAMLLDADAMKIGCEELRAVDFYDFKNQRIFSAFHALQKQTGMPDILILENYLTEHKEKIPADYVRHLCEAVPSAANIEIYCRMVKDGAKRRRAQVAGTKIKQLAEAAGDPAEISEIAKTIISKESKKAASGRIVTHKSVDLDGEFTREANGEIQTYPLPWPILSNLTRALRPGGVVIIAGPPGNGKTMFMMQLCISLHMRGAEWIYIPLEERRVDYERRVLASLSNDWRVVEDDIETAPLRQSLLESHRADVVDISTHISENPMLPVLDTDGGIDVPSMPYLEVLEIVCDLSKSKSIIVIDPLSGIEFGHPMWPNEKAFMRRLAGIASATNAIIIIVAHTVKRPGKAHLIQLCGDDVQGAAEMKRYARCMILIDVHDEMTSEVYRPLGQTESIVHERTVLISKARWGRGMGTRIAFTMREPRLKELGVIIPQSKKKGVL